MADLEALLDLPDIGYRSYGIGQYDAALAAKLRLPSVPGQSVERYFAAYRQEQALNDAIAQGIAYSEDRARAVIMRAKARAEARLAQAYAEGRL